MRRVVITGLGIVAPNGTGVEYAWKNVVDGVSGVRKIDIFDASDLASQIAGVPVVGTEPGQYNPDAVVDPRDQRKLDRSMIYGLVAADEAIRDAGLIDYDGDKERVGVSIGSGIGGMTTIYETCVELHENGPRHVSPFFVPKGIINMTAGNVSIKYGFKGTITLKYSATGERAITGLKRISKPGLRVYAEANKVPSVLKGLGIAIVSTPNGLLTDRQARKGHVGGEVIAYVW